MQVQERRVFVGVDDVYCRCCFKIFKNINERIAINDEFLERIRKLFNLAMLFTDGSRWICTNCDDIVRKFWKFKMHVIGSQSSFCAWARTRKCKIISEIQKLGPPPDLWEEPQKVMVNVIPKQEVTDPLKTIEEVTIKEDPINVPDTAVIIEHPTPPTKNQPKPKSTVAVKVATLNKKIAQAPKRDIQAMYRKFDLQILPPALPKAVQCKFCKKYVKDMPGHLNKDHGEENKFRCSACGYESKSRIYVKRHIENIHLELRTSYKFRCEICHNIASDINIHYRVKHKMKEQGYKCGLCDRKAFVKEAIQKHIEEAHSTRNKSAVQQQIVTLQKPPQRDKKCPDCGKRYKNLRAHRRTHRHRQFFNCSGCTFRATSREETVKHITDVHQKTNNDDESREMCEYCGKAVKSLKNHIRTVHKRKTGIFTCDQCGTVKTTRANLLGHIKRQHSPKTINCTFLHCKFMCAFPDQLKTHLIAVHTEKKFACPIPGCKTRFKKEANIKQHLLRHKKEANCSCREPTCTLKFVTPIEEKNHYLNSHAPKNIICEHCGAAFGTEKALRDHIYVHAKEKWSCDICGKKFNRQRQVQLHMYRMHVKEKNLGCDEEGCKARFAHLDLLKRHKESVHGPIKFHCQVPGCTSTLSRRDAYRNHIKGHKELTEAERDELREKLKQLLLDPKNKNC